MEQTNKMLKLLLGILIPTSIIVLLFLIYLCTKKSSKTFNNTKQSKTKTSNEVDDLEILGHDDEDGHVEEQLICFRGGEDLTISDILDAPGEVIGKSSYGSTLYKANIPRKTLILLLRFLRPTCSVSTKEVIHVVHAIGLIRHTNLVDLRAFYLGSRGEKLLVYQFFEHVNLSQFIKDGKSELHNWDTIYNIVLGIVKGLAHLHSGLQKPMIHGNLKSKNVLLDSDFQPHISDYGLHLLLNSTAGQEMLESSAAQGYKAPELMKIKDTCESTDVYSLGIILLELLTGREPVKKNASDSQEMYLPNVIRRAILDHRIKDVYRADIVINLPEDQGRKIEELVLKLVQIAMSCCSPSPSLRPQADEVVRKVEELRSREQYVQHRS